MTIKLPESSEMNNRCLAKLKDRYKEAAGLVYAIGRGQQEFGDRPVYVAYQQWSEGICTILKSCFGSGTEEESRFEARQDNLQKYVWELLAKPELFQNMIATSINIGAIEIDGIINILGDNISHDSTTQQDQRSTQQQSNATERQGTRAHDALSSTTEPQDSPRSTMKEIAQDHSDTTALLNKLASQMDALSSGQAQISDQLRGFREDVVKRYSAGEQAIIGSISGELNLDQARTARFILDALEEDVPTEVEARETLYAIQKRVNVIEQRGNTLPQHHALDSSISDLNMDVRHKLKLTIPIIPFILDYEGEIEVGSGTNLGSYLTRVMNKIRGV